MEPVICRFSDHFALAQRRKLKGRTVRRPQQGFGYELVDLCWCCKLLLNSSHLMAHLLEMRC